MTLKEELKEILQGGLQWVREKINPLHLQVLGYATTALAYVILAYCKLRGIELTDNVGHLIWLGLLLFAGIPEVVLIYVWDITITQFGRKLLPKWLDTIIMVGLIPTTWAIFGPQWAVLGFVHYISGHYGERQPKGE